MFSVIPELPPRPVPESDDEDEEEGDAEAAEGDELAGEGLSDADDSSEKEDDKHSKERLERTVFVGNVPVGTNPKALKKLFKKYGTVESVRIRSVALAKESLTNYRKVRAML